jgi:hypothetical protein
MFSRLLLIVAISFQWAPPDRRRASAGDCRQRRRGLPQRWNEAGNAGICQVPGRHVEPAAHVRNGNAYRHAESDMEPARDDEEPDDDGALITPTLACELAEMISSYTDARRVAVPHGAVCDHCPRSGQYRKETLIARFGGDVLMPDARHLIAECPRRNGPGQACGVFYADLRKRGETH